ncbi:uncharacterized protein PFL1_02972 [Pseudozyma flocculosa PF-1]|uniref:DUF4246 domain-containing protein n=2 Tax=Pseudozyma flocculosa TaxID=84751 RepID=A0A5C3F2Y8_9BASI|nr:uncharacterized protein PFL1_02972 [Pseudozyma flocculosa PF-1]EPQ29753.1 hypothetical protein PFL1_02972 [Pseudozyma flocculosa PF-1]SPO38335.1 uncharacterized protein PSFLO_03812 [Pseudozyma flocculosa]
MPPSSTPATALAPEQPVRVSSELHAALIDLCTGILPAYLVGVPVLALQCYVDALIRIENGQQPLPARLDAEYSKLVQKAYKFGGRPFEPSPISLQACHALDRALVALGLDTLHSFFAIVSLSGVDQRTCHKLNADPATFDAAKPANGSKRATKKSTAAAAGPPPETVGLSIVATSSWNMSPPCLHHCNDPDLFARVNRLGDDGTWLLDPANFNRLVAAVHQEGASLDDTFTIAAVLATRMLGGGPDGYQHIHEHSYYRAPNVEFEAAEPYTAAEREVDAAIRALLEKDDWKAKAADETIAAKWRQEAIDQQGFSPSQADYLIAKMRYMATNPPRRGVEYSGVPGVYVSDVLVGPQTVDALKRTVGEYAQSIPETRRDYHPRSDDQVWNLVHPSLHPLHAFTPVLPAEFSSCSDGQPSVLAYNATALLKRLHPGEEGKRAAADVAMSDADKKLEAESAGAAMKAPYPPTLDGLTITLPDLPKSESESGTKYRWLPAEIRVDVDAGSGTPSASFVSYINGLSPFQDRTLALYEPLAAAFAALLPAFESVLASFPQRGDTAFLSPTGTPFSQEVPNSRKDLLYFEYFTPSIDEVKEKCKDVDVMAMQNLYWCADEDDRREALVEQEWEDNKEFVRPPVAPFEPPTLRKVELGGRTLQVIVKVSTILLTPDKPSYAGGSWHLEGTVGEHICATGIHYLDSNNVTDASLSFRMAVDAESMSMRPEQNQFEHLLHLYGIEQEQTATHQVLGSVRTRPGSSIAFPNSMQHQLSGFDLVDASRPGHRTIVLFWLIDPAHPVVSTARVVPQQVGWLKDATRHLWSDSSSRLSQLPPELIERIFDTLDAAVRADEEARSATAMKGAKEGRTGGDGGAASYLMSTESALEHRLKLMDERTAAVLADNDSRFDDVYSFCEH